MPRAQSFLPKFLNSRFFLFFQRIFGRHDRIESQDLEAIVRMKEIVITTEGESCSHFFFYFFFLREESENETVPEDAGQERREGRGEEVDGSTWGLNVNN